MKLWASRDIDVPVAFHRNTVCERACLTYESAVEDVCVCVGGGGGLGEGTIAPGG